MAEKAIELAKANESTVDLQKFREIRACVPLQLELVGQFSKELKVLGADPDTEIKHLYEILDDAKQLQAKQQRGNSEQHIDLTPGANETANDIDTLFRSGVLVGKPDGFDRHGNWGTRYEIAVAAHATYVRIKAMLKSSVDVDQARKASSSCCQPLLRLVKEFDVELRALGVGTKSVETEIASWQRQEPPNRRIIERGGNNAWIYDVRDRLRMEGLLVGYPDEHHSDQPNRWSNYGLAVATHATFVHMRRILANDRKAYLAHFDYAMSLTQDVEDLQRLAFYFAPELRALGVDIPDMKKTIFRWRTDIEDMWSADNMLHWAKSAASAIKTPPVN